MLSKLVKHELRATSRIMLPAFLVVLVLAALSNISVRLLDHSENTFVNLMAGTIVIAFTFSLIALVVISFVVMINRFRTNLMGDEGYIMFTLPASVHHLVWSKIIVSTLWFAGMMLVEFLAACVLVFNVEFLGEFWSFFREIFHQITAYYALNSAAIIAEILILFFVAFAGTCLFFYASMAVGYSFDRHKLALSVVAFFVFSIITQILSMITLVGIDSGSFNFMVSDAMAAVHISMWLMIVWSAVYAAIFYVITVVMLKRRLNLE